MKPKKKNASRVERGSIIKLLERVTTNDAKNQSELFVRLYRIVSVLSRAP